MKAGISSPTWSGPTPTRNDALVSRKRETVMRILLGAALAVLWAVPASAQRADQAEYRAVFQELVETNTTLASGSCTLAAEKMAARLRSAGFPASDLLLIVTPANPKEGSLVAV